MQINELPNLYTFLKEGKVEEALLVCEDIITQNPDHQEAINIYIDYSVHVDRGTAAYKFFLTLTDYSETHQNLHIAIGQLLGKLGVGENYKKNCYLAMQQKPGELTSYYRLAGILKVTGMNKSSESVLEIGEFLSRVLSRRPVFEVLMAPKRQENLDMMSLSQDPVTSKLLETVLNGFENKLLDPEKFWDFTFIEEISNTFAVFGQKQLSTYLFCMSQLISNALSEDSSSNMLGFVQEWSEAQKSTSIIEQEECIYFIACIMSPRVLKLASALKLEGKKVKLFTRLDVTQYGMGEQYFDDIVILDKKFDLWKALSGRSPTIVHTFLNLDNGFFEALTAFILYPDKTIFDFYDLSDPNLSPIGHHEEGSEIWLKYDKWNKIQKFMINHGTGICSRYAKSKEQKSNILEFQKYQDRIYLPEMSWGTIPKRSKLSTKDGLLHVVHGGTFWKEDATDGGWACMHEVAKRAEEFKFHFHLYPMSLKVSELEFLKSKSQDSEYFHIHKEVDYKDWLNEIAIYDVGLFYIHPTDRSLENGSVRMKDPSGNWANKFGDFVDSELYILLSPLYKSMAYFANKYNIGCTVNSEGILMREFWDQVNHEVLIKGVDFSIARKVMSISAHGDRLIKFYNKTVSNNYYSQNR